MQDNMPFSTQHVQFTIACQLLKFLPVKHTKMLYPKQVSFTPSSSLSTIANYLSQQRSNPTDKICGYDLIRKENDEWVLSFIWFRDFENLDATMRSWPIEK